MLIVKVNCNLLFLVYQSIYLCLLGFGAYLLVWKAMYFGGIYDTWSPGGGDVRIITNPTLSPVVIFGYILKSPFGGDGWIPSVDVRDVLFYEFHNGYLNSFSF